VIADPLRRSTPGSDSPSGELSVIDLRHTGRRSSGRRVGG
jgi:hypothetical protein